ncbi:MAG: metallophosphoesterase, partial [Nitrososphaeraceae archaeon]
LISYTESINQTEGIASNSKVNKTNQTEGIASNSKVNKTNQTEGIASNAKVNNTNQPDQKFVVIASGDWGCNKHTERNINDISNKNPDLVLSTGDMSYEKEDTCFYDIVKPLYQKFKISLGNHDMEEDGSKELQQAYFSRFQLSNTFYSFNYKNTHFIMLDSYSDNTASSEQYLFVKKDLEVASKDNETDWIIVVMHEPFYTNPGRHPPHTEFAKVYHSLFDKYGVNLVLAGHNHWYERSFPLKCNPEEITEPITQHHVKMEIEKDLTYKSKKRNEIVSFATIPELDVNSTFKDSENPIFITVGTGGKKQHNQKDQLSYIPYVWDHGFGYLKLEINHESIKGNFFANEIADREGKKIIEQKYIVRDSFTISKP